MKQRRGKAISTASREAPLQTTASRFQLLAVLVMILVVPWALYINFHPRFQSRADPEFGYILETGESKSDKLVAEVEREVAKSFGGSGDFTYGDAKRSAAAAVALAMSSGPGGNGSSLAVGDFPFGKTSNGKPYMGPPLSPIEIPHVKTYATSNMPVLGPYPSDGAVPLYGVKHSGGDAIFALAANYPKQFYQRFVGSLRKAGYTGDIVLAVSPPAKMKPNVEKYIKETKVVAYGFDVDCKGKDNCRFYDNFLGYPDPRPFRTFANIRYAMYEYWLRYYTERSYILILDFRDTFFQADPFLSFGPFASRTPKFELQVFAENHRVKSIGKCVYNSLWIGRCFGRPALAALSSYPVLCSGSTLGSYLGIKHYVRTMLSSMDTVKCWLKGIESDQGYQNYLFYNGYFSYNGENATLFQQGTGVVNTIGALNGKRFVLGYFGYFCASLMLTNSPLFVSPLSHIQFTGSQPSSRGLWTRTGTHETPRATSSTTMVHALPVSTNGIGGTKTSGSLLTRRIKAEANVLIIKRFGPA